MEPSKLKLPKKRCKLGDIAQLMGVKKFILREWEKQFDMPRSDEQDEQLYSQTQLDRFSFIKMLIYDQGNNIEKARELFDQRFVPVNKDEPVFVCQVPQEAALSTESMTQCTPTAVELAPEICTTPKSEAVDPDTSCPLNEITAEPSTATTTQIEPVECTTIACAASALETIESTTTCVPTAVEPAHDICTVPEELELATEKTTPTIPLAATDLISELKSITGAVRAQTLPAPSTIELASYEATEKEDQTSVLGTLRNQLETLKAQLTAFQSTLAPTNRKLKDQAHAPY